ncbi:MAG TPA: hypothetical protein VLK28_01855 [Methylomirabilota bacterium]|nr:hypothetical protein [Methylomirabilota bacterium]
MHPPEGAAWLVWLETSALAVAMRQWQWLYPIVEILHILGFVLVVGGAFYFDLRLLGRARSLPVSGLAAHLLAWARAGFGLVAPTGLMMFAAHATEFAVNPAFRLKLILIAVALLNAAAFHRWPFRSVARWDAGARAPAWAGIAAVISLACWIGAIACGRLLAYL